MISVPKLGLTRLTLSQNHTKIQTWLEIILVYHDTFNLKMHFGSYHWNSDYSIHTKAQKAHAKFEIQNLDCEIQDLDCEIQNSTAKYKTRLRIQNSTAKSKTRVRNSKPDCEIQNLDFWCQLKEHKPFTSSYDVIWLIISVAVLYTLYTSRASVHHSSRLWKDSFLILSLSYIDTIIVTDTFHLWWDNCRRHMS
jgi:hypothetical protein